MRFSQSFQKFKRWSYWTNTDKIQSGSTCSIRLSLWKVISIGGLVKGIAPGDLVACAGAGYANAKL